MCLEIRLQIDFISLYRFGHNDVESRVTRLNARYFLDVLYFLEVGNDGAEVGCVVDKHLDFAFEESVVGFDLQFAYVDVS